MMHSFLQCFLLLWQARDIKTIFSYMFIFILDMISWQTCKRWPFLLLAFGIYIKYIIFLVRGMRLEILSIDFFKESNYWNMLSIYEKLCLCIFKCGSALSACIPTCQKGTGPGFSKVSSLSLSIFKRKMTCNKVAAWKMAQRGKAWCSSKKSWVLISPAPV